MRLYKLIEGVKEHIFSPFAPKCIGVFSCFLYKEVNLYLKNIPFYETIKYHLPVSACLGRNTVCTNTEITGRKPDFPDFVTQKTLIL